MRILIIVTLSVVALVVLVLAWGATLPTTKSLSKAVQVDTPVDIVWKTMSDWEGQVKWWSEVKSVEIVDEKTFKEFPSNGPAVEFEIGR